MKKLVVSLTLIVVLINFIFGSCSYAAEGAESSIAGESKMVNILAVDNATPENGYAAKELEGDGEENEQYGATIMGTIVGLLGGAINLLAFQIDLIIGQLTFSTENSSDLQYFFTIERAVFNRIPLFNVNFFEMGDTYEVGSGEKKITIESSPEINAIKERVAQMFYIVRVIAVGLSLIVLVFIGIRMAMSTLSDDKAKYKKMLIGWVESVVILFLLEYIMVAVVLFGEMLTRIFYDLEVQLLSVDGGNPKETFEAILREQIWTDLFKTSGLNYALYTVMYLCLLFMHIKYFWVYMKRVLMVGFLIMIAPLITVTYGIDKAGDGKAQAFSIWMKEYVVNVLIQPLHALIYLIFVLSAGEIAKVSPIIALAFLMCMGVVERMVKVIFDLKGLVSLRGLDKLGKN